MTMNDSLKAALMGLALAFAPVAGGALAETLTVVKKGGSATLDVPMNRAIVVESDVPFSELSIANPGIADISSLSDRTIYVLGKSPGLTTLTLLDATGRLITNVEVRVSADVTEFKERLTQILPGERIEVEADSDCHAVLFGGPPLDAPRYLWWNFVSHSEARIQQACDDWQAQRYAMVEGDDEFIPLPKEDLAERPPVLLKPE